MKKTRVLSLVLALLMCIGMVTTFASCSKKDGDVRLSKKMVDVDLTDYALVYADSCSSTTFKGFMAEFGEKLNAATGLRISAKQERASMDTMSQPEILVGLTGRQESIDAYEKIKGYGFTIEVVDNKIVIVGSNNILTFMAVTYFIDTFLTGVETPNAVLSINKTAKAKKLDMITVGENGVVNMNVIHQDGIDTDPGVEYGAANAEMRAYAYDAAEQIRQTLLKSTQAPAADNKLGTDAKEQSGAEIMIGRVDRASCTEVLAEMKGNEYGVFVRNGDIVVTSWSDAGLVLAAELFKEFLNEAKVVDEKDESKIAYMFPSGFKFTRVTDPSWVVEFPKPEGEGIELINTVDCSDGALQFLYQGEGVDADAYTAYCAQLKAAGYTLYGGVDVREVEGSYFAVYENKKENIALYVAYNAFAHADEVDSSSYATQQNSGQYFIHYDDSEDSYAKASIRIVSYQLDKSHLADTTLLKKTSTPNKVTDAALISVALPEGHVGTGYVMMLEDASFIIFDGGASLSNTNPYIAADKIYDIVSSLHKEYKGDITSTNKIHIRAWINSHSHGDHTGGFYTFGDKYGKGKNVQVDYLIGSYPSKSQTYNTAEGGPFGFGDLESLAKRFDPAPKYIEVHTGQLLYFPNVEIEILFTHEDLNPHDIVTGNDASTLYRLTLQPTKNGRTPDGKKTSFMFTGDMYRYGGQWTCAMFGDYLKSDMVSLTHHGGPGADEQFFEMVDAEVAWWPMLASSIMGESGTAKDPKSGYLAGSSWHCKADQKCLELADYLFVADDYNIVLFFDKNGPKLEEIKKINNGIHDINLETDHNGRDFWYKDREIVRN